MSRCWWRCVGALCLCEYAAGVLYGAGLSSAIEVVGLVVGSALATAAGLLWETAWIEPASS